MFTELDSILLAYLHYRLSPHRNAGRDAATHSHPLTSHVKVLQAWQPVGDRRISPSWVWVKSLHNWLARLPVYRSNVIGVATSVISTWEAKPGKRWSSRFDDFQGNPLFLSIVPLTVVYQLLPIVIAGLDLYVHQGLPFWRQGWDRSCTLSFSTAQPVHLPVERLPKLNNDPSCCARQFAKSAFHTQSDQHYRRKEFELAIDLANRHRLRNGHRAYPKWWRARLRQR